MKLVLIISSILLLSSPSNALEGVSYKPIRINLGAFYSAKRVYRGALIWNAPILAMGPTFTFFDFISLGKGGGLSIFKTFEDYHTLRIGVTAFNDNKPNFPAIRLKSSDEDFKNQRSSSVETFFNYTFRYKRYASLSASHFKELKRHYGTYSNFKLSTSVIPFLTIGTGLGIGSLDHNKYAYGPEGSSGIAHHDYFARIMLPFLPWKGRLMLNYNYTSISKKENYEADFIRGRRENNIFSVGAMWVLL